MSVSFLGDITAKSDENGCGLPLCAAARTGATRNKIQTKDFRILAAMDIS
jgi:hypothetical protein